MKRIKEEEEIQDELLELQIYRDDLDYEWSKKPVTVKAITKIHAFVRDLIWKIKENFTKRRRSTVLGKERVSMAVVKIAPKREGQREELMKIEERMHFLLYQIAEYDRIIRQAREAEEKLASLRQQLARLAEEYVAIEKEGA